LNEGEVHLVGAGPGDPGLLTVRGKELIQQADVLVHDALVDSSLLELNPQAERVDAGKRGGEHTLRQEEINERLADLAEQGKMVVRLKGGDPFLFGRGAEEAEHLRRRGITVHVVPGVTSAIAVPELCGVPVTHRDHSSQVTIVTGHERAGRDEDRIDWAHLAESKGTIVVLMGMGNLRSISASLLEGGMPAETPVAVMTEGSTEGQRTLVSRLGTAAEDVERAGLKAPGIIVIGGCVERMVTLGDLR